MSVMERRAARGAALLDEKLPGWWRRIRRRGLDMDSGIYRGAGDCGCILAQLYPGWHEGIRALEVTAPAKHGFGRERPTKKNPTPLRDAWLDQIRRRARR